jgi:rubredoxin
LVETTEVVVASVRLVTRDRGIDHLVQRPTPDARYRSGMSTTTTTQKWICESCGFIYDPVDGDPDGGIPPGTTFEDIPETWFCPVCGARKRDFVVYED